MNTKVKGLAFYFFVAVILQCVTVLVTAMAQDDPQPTIFGPKNKELVSESSRATVEDLAILAATLQTAHDSARRFIETFSKLTENQDPIRLDATDVEPAQVRATRMIHSQEENSTTIGGWEESEPSLRNSDPAEGHRTTESSVESVGESAPVIAKLETSEGDTVDIMISVSGNDVESEPNLESGTLSSAATSITDYLTSLGTSEGDKVDSVSGNDVESEPNLESGTLSSAATSITDYLISLGTSEGDTVDKVSGNDAESGPNLESGTGTSSSAATSITDYLTSLGTSKDPSVLNDITASEMSTVNNSSESLRQDFPASLLNNTNLEASEQMTRLKNETESNLHIDNSTKADNVTMNISTVTMSEVVFSNVPNRTDVGSSKLTSPFRSFIDVINNVFREHPLYEVMTAANTRAYVGAPADEVKQNYRISLVNISNPDIMKLNSKPIKSVFDFLSRVSKINPIFGDYDDTL